MRWLFPLLILFCSCSSNTPQDDEDAPIGKLMQQLSRSQKTYDGLSNTLDVRSTLLTSALRDLQIEKKAHDFKWNEAEQQSQREKDLQQRSTSTDIFISLFTPNQKHNNLTSKKSLWKVFLDAGGHRYSAKITEIQKTVEEIQKFYPYHNRWSTAYLARFSIPTTGVESSPAILTITGTLGSTSISFTPPLPSTPNP